MTITPFIAGSLGALCGLLVAVAANLFVLPFVLRAQDEGFVMGRKAVPDFVSREQLAVITRFMYRVPMPVLFTFVGWFAGLKAFGG